MNQQANTNSGTYGGTYTQTACACNILRLCVVCLVTIAFNPPVIAQSATGSYVLGPSDKLQIRVLGIEELDGKTIIVDPEGNIDVPMVGTVKASGQTLEHFQSYLHDRLAKYVIDPKVNLTVTDYRSRPITVIGAVNKPGVLENTGADTLAEVISAAGGLRSDAGNIVAITRRQDAGPLGLANARVDASGQFSTAEVSLGTMLAGQDPSLNFAVLPGDVISVPRAEMVYVVGAVHHPTGFMLNERPSMTVMEAVSMAEGLDKTAQPKRGRILRADGHEGRTELPVDVNKILAGRSPDIALLPNDILVIPDSMIKRVTARSAEALMTTVSGYVMLH